MRMRQCPSEEELMEMMKEEVMKETMIGMVVLSKPIHRFFDTRCLFYTVLEVYTYLMRL